VIVRCSAILPLSPRLTRRARWGWASRRKVADATVEGAKVAGEATVDAATFVGEKTADGVKATANAIKKD
jgi:hypothetical protein